MKLWNRLLCSMLAVAVCVLGGALEAMADATPHPYTTDLNDVFTTLNFAGASDSFVTVLASKTQPLMIGVITVCVIAGIVWRLSGKTKKIAG